mgnify:CR=1 FL=1
MFSDPMYSAAIYARLSREDSSGVESNSITNQISYIQDFLTSKSDIRLVSIRKDDGYSGADFSRPDFEAMMTDIKNGIVNCVIVKDFSRFGRNHLEVAEYLEHLFPFLGVRFISINDNYDSIDPMTDTDHIVIPFKNLVNESYLRDISIKVRTSLDSKRKKGEFVANFAPYGYMRDPEDKHRMIVDPYAAKIVRRIFDMKISGQGHQKIADTLNAEGELVPIDYRNVNGLRQFTPLKKNAVTSWNYTTVDRILKNSVYIGTLAQGKVSTPSYKIKKNIVKPREEWAVLEDAHPSIISRSDFEIVGNLLKMDTRTAAGDDELLLFSGLLYCGDCENSMVRKTVPVKGKKYVYYVCASSKYDQKCSPHSIQEIKLKEIIFELVMAQIRLVSDLQRCLETLKAAPLSQREKEVSRQQLHCREVKLEEIQRLRKGLYEDYKAGILTREDFLLFHAQYTAQAEQLKNSIQQLKEQTEVLSERQEEAIPEWINRYREFENAAELSRKMLVSLVQKVFIYDKKRIRVIFYFQDKIALLQKQLSDSKESGAREEEQ